MRAPVRSIRWAGDRAILLDQTRLPAEEVELEISDHRQMIEAIKALRIRGAPALGVAAAYGIVLGALSIRDRENRSVFLKELEVVRGEIVSARPTAVNMAWAARRMWNVIPNSGNPEAIQAALISEAARILEEDVRINMAMGAHGAALISQNATVITHCNTGSLATAGYGTALGVLRAAREQGKNPSVIATETRPLLQGARLTAWELVRDGFPATLITDSMIGHVMKTQKISCVIVGADRIAANGDTANKIGTYTLAIVAKEHGVPFYIAAPTSTIDATIDSGDQIPIEERSPEEVLSFRGMRVAPAGISVANPAFDVTPSTLIAAIVTEHGIARAPYRQSLKHVLDLAVR